MTMEELALSARSYRRFDEARAVDPAFLEACVNVARRTPSAGNRQPLRYALSTSARMNATLFANVSWAAKLRDWPGPAEGQRPAAYIVIGGDMRWPTFHGVDLGIAAQTLNLLLAEAGLRSCMLANIKAGPVAEAVGFPEGVKALLVLAIGYPAETVVLEEAAPGGDLSYYRDAADAHHVPKMGLDEVLLGRFV